MGEVTVMSEPTSERDAPAEPDSKPEPLKLDVPQYDYVEKGADHQRDIETHDLERDTSDD